MSNEGRKDDNDKLRYDLEPQDARAGKVAVLTDGAKRYGVRNWEAGMEWGRVYAALQRHMAAWWGGETTDPDSGRPHLDHAACCLDFLSAYEKRGVGTDDRPRAPRPIGDIVTEIENRLTDEELAEVRDAGPKGPIYPAVSEQVTDVALKNLWSMLGASNQTEAVQKLRALTADDGKDCKAYEVRQARVLGSGIRSKFHCPDCEEVFWDGETKPCERLDPEWVRNDGKGQSPVPSDFSVDWRRSDGKTFRNILAGDLRWDENVTHWRVAEVDGWKPWGGGHLPSGKAGIVEVMLRGGRTRQGPMFRFCWQHDGINEDIVGYRHAGGE